MSARRWGTRWSVVALTWTVVIGIGWLVVPTGTRMTVSSDAPGPPVITRETLLQTNGPHVLIVLAVPVAIAALAVAASRLRRPRRARYICAGALLAGCLLGAASVGLFYLPAAGLLFVAADASPRFRGDPAP